MDRERLQKIKDWVVFILLVVFLFVSAIGVYKYGSMPIGEAPVWLIWVMALYIVWGLRKDG